jgi:hypothetical protein
MISLAALSENRKSGKSGRCRSLKAMSFADNHFRPFRFEQFVDSLPHWIGELLARS